MTVALVNPPWAFEGSIYFGCREPHLPLELAYAQALLNKAGIAAHLLDGHAQGWTAEQTADAVAEISPDLTVVTTAPTYLFWRCPPPELRAPMRFLEALADRGGRTVAVGPHPSATPRASLRKLGCDFVIRGECERAIVALAQAGDPLTVPGVHGLAGREMLGLGGLQAVDMQALPALSWRREDLHSHHHHRFDAAPDGFGAEVEASRGCPYACTFCAKSHFRDRYRRRSLEVLLAEIDGLIALGVTYLYFIDEIFLPWGALLEALAARPVAFGVQTRIDLWRPDQLNQLGEAGCVSIEAGVESLRESGRQKLSKDCRHDLAGLEALLLHARRKAPFVQANLIDSGSDSASEVEAFRARMRAGGVWANDPVPLFPYPSSPDYERLFGPPDDRAWERAHAHYLRTTRNFSDIQDATPLSLAELERQGA